MTHPVLFRLALLTLALGLAGCVFAPATQPQTQAVDAQALGLNGAAMPTVASGWWERFGDPQLNALINDALASNPGLNEAMARVRVAQAQSLAASAGGLPSLSLDGQEQRERVSENSFYPSRSLGFSPGGGGTYWVGQLGLNLNWDLDFWGRQADLLHAARHEADAARLDKAAARLALSGALAQAYVDLYRAYLMIDVATAIEQQREAQLKLAGERLQAGLDARTELNVAKAALPQARLARLQAENARDLAVHRLAALSGHGADFYASIQRPSIKPDTALPLPADLPVDLLAHRPDVLAAKARVEAATDNRSAAKAAFYPDFSLSAFAGYQSFGLDKLLEGSSRTWGVGPAVHLPLFDAHRLKAAYIGATAELDAAVASYNDTVLSAVRDAADQISRVDSLTQQRVEAAQALQTAQSTQDIVTGRYKAGLGSRLPVLNAGTQVLNAQRDLINIETSLVIARVTLLLTLGGSFAADEAQTPAAVPATSSSVTSSSTTATPVAASGAST